MTNQAAQLRQPRDHVVDERGRRPAAQVAAGVIDERHHRNGGTARRRRAFGHG
jgi:hypothetical protein